MTDQTEANDRCVKCGHPRNNHPYRHPFQSLRNPMTDAKDKRIAELEAERDETMSEALSLARSLHKSHYSDVTQWEPLTYPAGVVSQIDNMVAGIVARAEAAEAKLEKAEDCLTNLSKWRRDCHRYDADCGHELREFDIDDVAMMESKARTTLAELKGGKDG